MAIPKKKTSQQEVNVRQQDVNEEIPEIRKTKRWKDLYNRNLQSKSAMRSTSKKLQEEAYCKMIDRLASAPPLDNNNLLAGWNDFVNGGK